MIQHSLAYLALAVGVPSIANSVCLFVCRFARVPQKRHVQNSPNFLYVLPVAARSSFDGNAIRYVLPVCG